MNKALPETLPKDVEALAAQLSQLKGERNRRKDTLRVSEHDRTPQCVADVSFRKYLSV